MLGLFGSPRRGGNTDLMLEGFLRGCESAGASLRRIRLAELQIKGCQSCAGCAETGRCLFQDDMQTVYAALEESSHIVLASPVYFYGITAQAKLVIDRTQALWSGRRLREVEAAPPERKGFFLSAAATRGKRVFEGALLTVMYFFDAIGARYEGELLFAGFDEKGAIRNHPTALMECFEAGSRFVS
ncbi:MAG: flavodoxin family protein [bacterium]